MAAIKEFNLRMQYETKHQDKLKDLNTEQKKQKVKELKKNLEFQQTSFTKAKSQSEAVAVKAGFIVAKEIPKSALPCAKGEFLKKWIINFCDVLCPDKMQMLVNVSLSRNTIADRVCELSTNLRTQLSERSRDFIAYSLAVDESTDMTGTAQLPIFIRVVDSNLRVREEIVNIKSMHGTTTGENVCQSVTNMKVH